MKRIFNSEGVLAKNIKGFVPRQAQTEMAERVNHAIESNESLVVEAGTGTGKTFAYLAPALLSGKKVILSTGSKNLQEQLYNRDLPVIKKALANNKQDALLKGRANYLCLHRLAQHSGNSVLLDKNTLSELSAVRKWANYTKVGDLAEVEGLPEDAKVIPFVTSSVDNCLGKDCDSYQDCYLVKARRKALESQLVVVNHHLFFADLAIKDNGFGELIPDADVIIFDEAHQLPDIANDYFGESLSSRQIQELCKDIDTVYRTSLNDAKQLGTFADKLQVSAQDLRLCFPKSPTKGHWLPATKQADTQKVLGRIGTQLEQLSELVKLNLARDEELDKIYDRLIEIRGKFARLTQEPSDDVSLWFETTNRHIIVKITPLSVADKFRKIWQEGERSWIFTSATLSVDHNFDHFKGLLGIEACPSLALDSPFDYQNQALFCVPRYLPAPQHASFISEVAQLCTALINASKGRCFLLFTSHFALRSVANLLEDKVPNKLLVQGQSSKSSLLEQYLDETEAVLLGTSAFWEGIDVKGNDLICVLIDKLPFAAPGDPLLDAKMSACRKQGKDPFKELQLPHAVIALKQGAGRLIRDGEDKGVLVVCDNRLVNRDYGKIFINSLPNMKRTRELDGAIAFIEKINESSAS